MKKIFISFCVCLFAISCNSSKNAAVQKNITNKMPEYTDTQQSKPMLQTGIDFFAQGNQPTNWQLTINYDDTVRFKADDGLALKFAYNQLKKELLPGKTIYTIKLKAGDIVINILDKICTVSTMREVFKKEVTVNFNNIIYTGCGKFLADENLNTKWVLEKIGNTTIKTEEYNKIPILEFNLKDDKISGNDGCNNISGKIEVQGKRIQFFFLLGTKMSCNKKSIEKIIGEQISNQIVSYFFKDGKLYLYLPDDSLLIFKKEG